MEMLIRVLPNKVVEPKLWEAIKYAAVQVDAVEENHRQAYLNNLLYGLLCGDMQCFLYMDDKLNKIKTVIITKIVTNEVYQKKIFCIGLAYAFEHIQSASWDKLMETLKKVAISEECSEMSLLTDNPKAAEIGIRSGYIKTWCEYNFSLGGFDGQLNR